MNADFPNWLSERGLKDPSVSSRLSEVRRVEKHYGDLDLLYDQDRLAGVFEQLAYSKDDERRNRANPSEMDINGNLYDSLASLRGATKLYCEFREAPAARGSSAAAAWDRYLGLAKQRIEDGTLDREEGSYKSDLAAAVAAARVAVLRNTDDWPALLTAAIGDRKNNLIDGRAYAKGRDSDQAKVGRWIETDRGGVREALLEMWKEDDRDPGDRVRSFDDHLPTDVFSEGSRKPRLDVAAFLMMGLDAQQFPPIRRGRFQKTYEHLSYRQPAAADIGTEYEHALRFLDTLLEEASRRGMERPSTRLDAQSVVWLLSGQLDELGNGNDRDDAKSLRALNMILYGPPGTGKTYTTVRRCVEICDGDAPQDSEELRARYGALMGEGRVEFVTFHQSYGYEEFVEGLRPVAAEDGGMRLDVREGVLKRIAERARKSAYLGGVDDLAEAQPYVLVIDEINRANISKVMGEMITLLEEDKRDGAENEVAVTLPYSGSRFSLPGNLYILGTMNTADRSIAVLDTALRRRFRFEEMSPEPELLVEAADRTGVDLPAVLGAMNERLEYLLDRDHLIGHAWFMAARTRADVDAVMRDKIIPLIGEYFYDDWRKVQAVLDGTAHFVEGESLSGVPGLDPEVGEERYRWTVRRAFAKDAYDRLVTPARSREAAE